jgi:hypothetical protein
VRLTGETLRQQQLITLPHTRAACMARQTVDGSVCAVMGRHRSEATRVVSRAAAAQAGWCGATKQID